MDAKLTLSINKEIARKAKKYARDKGSSLSALVENYLKLLTQKSGTEQPDFSPVVRSLLGSVSIPDDFDYKSEVSDFLSEKYLKNE